MKTIAPLAVMVTMLASASLVHAHALDPALLELVERTGGTVSVTWKASELRVAGSRLEPVLPDTCRSSGKPAVVNEGSHVVTRWTVDCGTAGLVGGNVGVSGLGTARTDALVRITFADGRVVRRVVRPREPLFRVPDRPGWWQVVGDYGRLGVEHILSGPDHLLFVCGLVLLVVGARPLAAAVTAFTLGHSITLAAAVLGLVRVASQPVELMIALTVLALAVELTRPADPPTFTRSHPWLMAGSFGLLHGLGFAGSLREAGLPDGDVPLALLGFNAGVEVGQLLFVGAVLAVRALFAGLGVMSLRWSRVAVYAMGSLAARWCIERAEFLWL